MQGRTLTVAFALIGACLANAQFSPLSLTPACSSSVLGLLASPDAQCLNLGSLLAYFISSNNSLPQTANVWLTGLCAAGTCTDDNIATIVSNVTKGCSDDFSNLGIDSVGLSDQVTGVVQQIYPTIRQVACLHDMTTNELCVPQALRTIETMFGTLSLSGLTPDTLNQDAQIFLNANITPIACTSCAKAAYNIGVNDLPEQVSQANPVLGKVCGPSFLDRNATSNIVRTASSNRFSLDLADASVNSGFKSEPFTLAAVALLVAYVFVFVA